MKLLSNTIENIEQISIDSDGKLKDRFNNLAIPSGSLGRLEEFATIYASIKGSPDATIKHKVVFTMAGDHGVASEGVSVFPQEVTRQMVKNFEETGLYESDMERKNREEKQLKRTKRLESNKKHHVSLLGDSIIDNKVYVGEGELSVTEHLQHNSSSYFSMIAVDGDTTEEVVDN